MTKVFMFSIILFSLAATTDVFTMTSSNSESTCTLSFKDMGARKGGSSNFEVKYDPQTNMCTTRDIQEAIANKYSCSPESIALYVNGAESSPSQKHNVMALSKSNALPFMIKR